MKLEPVTKLDKWKTSTLKKRDGDVVSTVGDSVVFFLIYGQFAAIWKPSFRCMVYKTYISLTIIFYITKTENWT